MGLADEAEALAISEALGVARLENAPGDGRAILLAHSEAQATRLAAAALALRPELGAVVLPGWDCLPFDRVSPSRAVMGRRMAALRAMALGATRLVVAGPEAVVQRLPPASFYREITVEAGAPICPEPFRASLERLGYACEEEADRPGDMAWQGEVFDVIPAAGVLGLRIRMTGAGRERTVDAIDRFDPATQRTLGPVSRALIGPASELVFAEGDEMPARVPGLEHRLAELCGPLVSVFDLLPGAHLLLDDQVGERLEMYFAALRDAHDTRTALARATGRGLPAEGLYVSQADWQARDGEVLDWPCTASVPRLRAARDPVAAARKHVGALRKAGMRVGVSGPRLARALRVDCAEIDGWAALLALPAGGIGVLPQGVSTGFATAEACVLADGDVLEPRATRPGQAGLFDHAWRIGDAVVHLDYGLARLDGIETVTAGAPEDRLVLQFAGDARKLVSCREMGRIWRYGAGTEGLHLDRADGTSWGKRRDAVLQSLEETARTLVAQVAARADVPAPALLPPRRPMDRFVAGFGFTPTPDQETAFAEIAADLARPHPMDRLLCGDVGFGKTEAALRAAAAAALSGRQVAVMAPTTVLVRQHLASFRRRFAPLDIEVAGLSRLTPAAERRRVRARLASGELRVVVGTQALASGVEFADLALAIIDEEQRFGAKAKAQLAQMRQGIHALTLSATPIPRTLEGALTGLQAISVLATPPARRQPVRTMVETLDEAVVKAALLREHARGGQSFCVCPRIEDLDRLAGRIAALAPDLSVVTLHGKMKPDALDAALVGFADGHGDVLLSTDIIEAGLDIPRANTILVWDADRFGLAQLHQLRGRVGRGQARGMAWLFTDPSRKPTRGAARRLAALAAHDGLGSGFVVAASDLDQRGAGDLLGEAQAGHAKLLGVELARHLLSQAMARARGETVQDREPDLVASVPAYLPARYIPDAAMRIALHARLSRGTELEGLREELEDRFGPLPDEVASLLELAAQRAACRRLGVTRLEAGPAGAAAEMQGDLPDIDGLKRRKNRLVLPGGTATDLLDRLNSQ